MAYAIGLKTRQPLCRIDLARHPAKRDLLVDVLCRAFDRDPHINWIVRQDTRRDDALRQLFRLLLTELMGRDGEVIASTDLKAVAIWFPPSAWNLDWLTQARLGMRFAAISGWKNLPGRAYGLNAMESKHPASPHYFLQTIGVDPSVQGEGYGAALLTAVLQRGDAAGRPIYLETGNPDNVRFYGKYGFRVVAETALRRGPTLFQMIRPAAFENQRAPLPRGIRIPLRPSLGEAW